MLWFEICTYSLRKPNIAGKPYTGRGEVYAGKENAWGLSSAPRRCSVANLLLRRIGS
jgi:hypothetical protein